jgi:hypothetical protein
LVYSNQKISEECQAQGKLKQPSAIVKRINTALTWIEHEFDISRDAFRTAFDRERNSNGIPIRGKDTAVDNTVLAANADKIDAAMTWVKTGGPRPTHITTATNLTGTNPLINHTGLTWIEREFEISPGAFRAIFDRERKANGIPVRDKGDAVDDAVIAANAGKTQAAMAWIKAGGPRP